MTAPNIQAIDRARAREPDVDRFRGAVLLRAGIYDIARSFRISAGVVVLRAHGDHPDSTVIRAVGKTRRVLLTLSGVVDHTEISHTRQRIMPLASLSAMMRSSRGPDSGVDQPCRYVCVHQRRYGLRHLDSPLRPQKCTGCGCTLGGVRSSWAAHELIPLLCRHTALALVIDPAPRPGGEWQFRWPVVFYRQSPRKARSAKRTDQTGAGMITHRLWLASRSAVAASLAPASITFLPSRSLQTALRITTRQARVPRFSALFSGLPLSARLATPGARPYQGAALNVDSA
jgi:hypothetical protein